MMPSAPLIAGQWIASLWNPASKSSVVTPERISQVRQQASALRNLSDSQLTASAGTLAAALRARPTECTADSMVKAFTLAFEAIRRILGMELYDEQIISGMTLCRGMIAEMATGEGKTICAALPAIFYALRGQSVHVATPNAYLAGRDCELLTPVYQLLNCSIGLLKENAPEDQKRAVYAHDIVYGTGYEFGFDYLREQLAGIAQTRGTLGRHYRDILRGKGCPSTGFNARRGVAIIDEIDSVMIDEACIPLIISEGGDPAAEGDDRLYAEALRVAERLREDSDYLIDREAHSVTLTKSGKLKSHLEMSDQSSNGLQRSWAVYIEQALQALLLLTKDVDYVTEDGKIVLVDGATGRLCPDRNWSDGLHQILEVKENLTHSGELRTAARITRQRYFRMYDMLCGMTGTAMESRWEFWRTYGLRVARIPLRRPCGARPCPRVSSPMPQANGRRRSRKSGECTKRGGRC